MSPIRIEISEQSFTAKNHEIGGVKVRGSNLGIAYRGTEDGGRVVIAHKDNNEIVCREPIEVHRGEAPVEKEIEYETLGGRHKVLKAKISAL